MPVPFNGFSFSVPSDHEPDPHLFNQHDRPRAPERNGLRWDCGEVAPNLPPRQRSNPNSTAHPGSDLCESKAHVFAAFFSSLQVEFLPLLSSNPESRISHSPA